MKADILYRALAAMEAAETLTRTGDIDNFYTVRFNLTIARIDLKIALEDEKLTVPVQA